MEPQECLQKTIPIPGAGCVQEVDPTSSHLIDFAIQKTKAQIASPKGHTDTIGTYLLSHIGCAKDSGRKFREFSP